MAVYRRTRPRFILVLLMLSAVTIVTLDGRGRAGLVDGARRVSHDVMAPVTRGADAVATPVGDWFSGVFRSASLRRDNVRLQREVRTLRNELRQRADVVRENDRLNKLVALTAPYDANPVTARVFAGAAGNFNSTVEIDRGSRDGISEGMPVVSADGLIGRVTRVANHSATVMLITDATSAVGIRFVNSGETAVAQGTSGRDLPVDLVDVKTDVKLGELAVTSGLQHGRFPAGLPVGVVSKVSPLTGSALQKSVRIRPVANLSRLDIVRVLHYKAPAA